MRESIRPISKWIVLLGCSLTLAAGPRFSVPPAVAPLAQARALPGSAIPALRGRLVVRIASLTERIGSFKIMSQGRLQDTGAIVLTLDPTSREQTISLDFDKGEIRIDTHLLINAPLLRRHGAGPTPITVSERGIFTISDLVISRDRKRATFSVGGFETTSTIPITTGPLAMASAKNRKKNDPAKCPRRPRQSSSYFVVSLGNGGNVGSATNSKGLSSLLCSSDRGVLSFEGRDTEFRGERDGTTF